VDEICLLKIYSYDSFSGKSDTDAMSVDGIVKRLAENKNEIAIVFIEESGLGKNYQPSAESIYGYMGLTSR
jgi:hypothetical protein